MSHKKGEALKNMLADRYKGIALHYLRVGIKAGTLYLES